MDGETDSVDIALSSASTQMMPPTGGDSQVPPYLVKLEGAPVNHVL